MKAPPKHKSRCHGCGRAVPGYDIIRYGSIEKGYRELCTRCFNTEVAESDGLIEFEHIDFSPIDLTDCAGNTHHFHFRTRLLGPGVAVDALEIRDGQPGGYQFQVIGDPEGDLLTLLARLIEKIRRALSVKHIREGEHGVQIGDNQVVRGRIKWDAAEEGRVPMLVIDGREFSWDEFGRMVMTFEGWQFKMEIRDKSEEL